MFAEDLLKVILSNVESVAKAKTILGDPIELGDKTVIPVCKVGVGFGAGGSDVKGDKNDVASGGGGGGFSVEPVAFLVLQGDEVNLLPIKQNMVGSFASAIPLTIDKISEMAEKAIKAKSCKKEKEEE
jgi:uncharacterized spore protein YtfJ